MKNSVNSSGDNIFQKHDSDSTHEYDYLTFDHTQLTVTGTANISGDVSNSGTITFGDNVIIAGTLNNGGIVNLNGNNNTIGSVEGLDVKLASGETIGDTTGSLIIAGNTTVNGVFKGGDVTVSAGTLALNEMSYLGKLTGANTADTTSSSKISLNHVYKTSDATESYIDSITNANVEIVSGGFVSITKNISGNSKLTNAGTVQLNNGYEHEQASTVTTLSNTGTASLQGTNTIGTVTDAADKKGTLKVESGTTTFNGNLRQKYMENNGAVTFAAGSGDIEEVSGSGSITVNAGASLQVNSRLTQDTVTVNKDGDSKGSLTMKGEGTITQLTNASDVTINSNSSGYNIATLTNTGSVKIENTESLQLGTINYGSDGAASAAGSIVFGGGNVTVGKIKQAAVSVTGGNLTVGSAEGGNAINDLTVEAGRNVTFGKDKEGNEFGSVTDSSTIGTLTNAGTMTFIGSKDSDSAYVISKGTNTGTITAKGGLTITELADNSTPAGTLKVETGTLTLGSTEATTVTQNKLEVAKGASVTQGTGNTLKVTTLDNAGTVDLSSAGNTIDELKNTGEVNISANQTVGSITDASTPAGILNIKGGTTTVTNGVVQKTIDISKDSGLVSNGGLTAGNLENNGTLTLQGTNTIGSIMKKTGEGDASLSITGGTTVVSECLQQKTVTLSGGSLSVGGAGLQASTLNVNGGGYTGKVKVLGTMNYTSGDISKAAITAGTLSAAAGMEITLDDDTVDTIFADKIVLSGGTINTSAVGSDGSKITEFTYRSGTIDAMVNAALLKAEGDMTLTGDYNVDEVKIGEGKTVTLKTNANAVTGPGSLAVTANGADPYSVGSLSGLGSLQLTTDTDKHSVLSVTNTANLNGTAVNLKLNDGVKLASADIGKSFLTADSLTGTGTYTINGQASSTLSEAAENYVKAGLIELAAAGNRLKLQKVAGSKTIYGGNVDGTSATGTANTLVLDGDTPTDGNIYAGAYSSSGDAKSGTIVVNYNPAEKNVTYTNLYGGYSAGSGEVSGNTVTVTNGTVKNIYGGYSQSGIVDYNNVSIAGGTVENIYGSNQTGGENTVNISGGKVTGTVANNAAGEAINILTYSGGDISGATLKAKTLNAMADITLDNDTAETLTVDSGKTATISGTAQVGTVDGSGATLNINPGGKVTTVDNVGTLNLVNDTTFAGTASADTVNYNGGTISDATITTNKLNVYKRLTLTDKVTVNGAVDIIDAASGVVNTTLRASLEKLKTVNVGTNSIFELQGELTKNITGGGRTMLRNDLTTASTGSVAGILELNGYTINLQNAPEATENLYSNISVGKLEGTTGKLAIDVDFKNDKSDTLTLTDTGSNATLTLSSIIVRSDDSDLAIGGSREISYLKTSGSGSLEGITTVFTSYTNPSDFSTYTAAATTTAKYTFEQGSTNGSLKVTKGTGVALEDFFTGANDCGNVVTYTVDKDAALKNGTYSVMNGKTLVVNSDAALAGNNATLELAAGKTLTVSGDSSKTAGKADITDLSFNNSGTLNLADITLKDTDSTADALSNTGTLNLSGNNSLAAIGGATSAGTTTITSGTQTIGSITQSKVNMQGGALQGAGEADTNVQAATFNYTDGDISKAAFNVTSFNAYKDVTLTNKFNVTNLNISAGKTATLEADSTASVSGAGKLAVSAKGETPYKVGSLSGLGSLQLTTDTDKHSVLSVTGAANLTGTAVDLKLGVGVKLTSADIGHSFLTADTLTGTGTYTINGQATGTVSETAANYVRAGKVKLAAADNALKLQNVAGTVIYGGIVDGTSATGATNTLVLDGTTPTDGNIYAGAYSSSGEATGGKVEVSAGTYGTVYGGYSAASGAVTGNTIELRDGSITNLYAGYSNGGSVTNNIINVYGTTASVTNTYLLNSTNKVYLNDGATIGQLGTVDFKDNVYSKVTTTTITEENKAALENSNVVLEGTEGTHKTIAADVEVKKADLSYTDVSSGNTLTAQTVDMNNSTVAGTVVAAKDATISGGAVSGEVKSTSGTVTVASGTVVSGEAKLTGKEVSLSGATITAGTGQTITLTSSTPVSIPSTTTVSLLDSLLTGSSIKISESTISGKVEATGIANLGSSSADKVLVSSDSSFTANGAIAVKGGKVEGTLSATQAMGIADGSTISGDIKVGDENNGGTLAIGGGTISGNITVGNAASGKSAVLAIGGGSISGKTTVNGAGSKVDISGATTVSNTIKVTGTNTAVTISGGTIDADIIGNGQGENGEEAGTAVSLTGGTVNSGKTVLANEIKADGTLIAGSTLKAHTIWLLNKLSAGAKLLLTGSTVNIADVGTEYEYIKLDSSAPAGDVIDLNFYIPATAVASTAENETVMLKLTDSTNLDLKGGTVSTYVKAGSPLQVGDEITLVNMASANILTNTATNLNGNKGTLIAGVSLEYGVETRLEDGSGNALDVKEADHDNGKKIITKVTSVPTGLREQTKSFVETMAANVAMLNGAADLFAGQGFEQAAVAASLEAAGTQAGAAIEAEGSSAAAGQAAASAAPSPARSMAPFAAMGGSALRSHSGSYVDSRGMNFALGMSKRVENSHGSLLFGPMLEYGRGSYASHLDDGTRGDGTTKSWGVGVFARQENHNGSYYEGSLRAGTINADYRSAAMGTYETEAPYVSFHVGAGKKVSLNAKDNVDCYAKYFFTHQNGDDVNIHTPGGDEAYSFGSVNSSRIRLGARWNHQLNKRSVIYLGAGWQYELDGEAVATYQGMQTPSPSVKGSSYLYELGWKISTKKDTSLDLNLTGWSGKQEGITFGARFNWGF